jgi:hypothetical protein
MADTLTLSNFTGLTENGAGTTGSTLDTGDLRRKFNFGDRVSMLNIAQDPFFRFISKLRKYPVDDPQFKFTEERPSFHKRYAYVVGHGTDGTTFTTNDATVTATNIEAGDTWYVRMKGDYKTAGNISNVYDATTAARSGTFAVGATGTQPHFFVPGQIIKINFGSDYETPNDFILGKIESVTSQTSEQIDLKLTITRTLGTATNNELQWSSATVPMATVYNVANANIEAGLESKRSYVVGNAWAKGSGYPETWQDNPYSTGYGLTQIWKTSLGMDNTTRATVLKYAGNEWARIWANKLIEHKWDIDTDLHWGRQTTDAEGVQYSQGIVDYALLYGNLFSLTHSSKTCDEFLDDMSQFFDPRYNNAASTLFLADTFTYNWLNKLSGYFNNNVQISPNFRADFSFKGTSNMLGVSVNRISTIYGDMNIARDIHLDGTGVSICYRPLVGNGLNRDTSVYVGVQTLENSGIDKRIDLILTEAGLEISGPERHCIWK